MIWEMGNDWDALDRLQHLLRFCGVWDYFDCIFHETSVILPCMFNRIKLCTIQLLSTANCHPPSKDVLITAEASGPSSLRIFGGRSLVCPAQLFLPRRNHRHAVADMQSLEEGGVDDWPAEIERKQVRGLDPVSVG